MTVARERAIVIRLTARELKAVFHLIDNSWDSGEWVADFLKGDAVAQRAATAGYRKLSAAMRAHVWNATPEAGR